MAAGSNPKRGVKTKLSQSLAGMKFMKRRQTDEQKLFEKEKEQDRLLAESHNFGFFEFDHGFDEKTLIEATKFEVEPFYQRISFGNFNPEIEYLMKLKDRTVSNNKKPDKEEKI